MANPNWNGSPSRYEPNPIDDRAVTDPDLSAAYLAIATAIEAIESIRKDPDAGVSPYRALMPATRRALNTAESALRRAAFGVVLYA